MATTRKTSPRSRSTAAPKAATPADALMAAAGTAAPETGAHEGGEENAALEKKAFIDQVVIASGVRKRDAKPAVEAALELLGKALDEGRAVKLAPLGQMRVVKSNDGGKNTTLTMKLRRKNASAAEGDDAVAEEGDAG